PKALLIKASSLLRDSSDRLMDDAETDAVPRLLDEASRCYDAIARKLSADDAETAATVATVAIGRSTAAALALHRCAWDELDCDWSWEDESDGPYLGHMREFDEDGISEPLLARAVETARAALDADPGDPLVPLQLGHALCWSGDRDGAVAAYTEVLRRDPEDPVARDRLAELGEAVPEEGVFGSPSPGRYAFALVRGEAGNASWGWSSIALASGTVAAARRDADDILKGLADADLTREELAEMLRLTLEIHRPGRPVTHFDLIDHVPAEPRNGSFLIDWSAIPEGEPLDPPLPPGRPVRIDGRTCFYGVSDPRRR
ncbi:tetratricopeptide repeat protein, partial [Streptomyces sp. 2MCAF27]